MSQPAGIAQADGPHLGEGAPAYAVVPEPATLVLLGAGVVAVVVVRRWK